MNRRFRPTRRTGAGSAPGAARSCRQARVATGLHGGTPGCHGRQGPSRTGRSRKGLPRTGTARGKRASTRPVRLALAGLTLTAIALLGEAAPPLMASDFPGPSGAAIKPGQHESASDARDLAPAPTTRPSAPAADPALARASFAFQGEAGHERDTPLDAAAGRDEDSLRWLPRLTLFTENDGGFIKVNAPTDRYYTAGNGASLTFQPDWADDLAAWLYGPEPDHHAEPSRRSAAGLFGGQLMFTPELLRTSELQENDHPYAGYLYGGGFWQSADAHALDHVRLELGLVGPSSLADQTQKWVHSVFGGDRPEGWNNQLPDEPTIQAFYRRKWKLRNDELGLGALAGELEVLPELSLALGTVRRHAAIGATLRYGVNLPTDFGPPRLDDLSGTDSAYEPGFGTYAYLRAAGRAVQHNMFIEGSEFQNSHGVEIERLVGRVEAGVQIYYQHEFWNLELGYGQTYLTRQFKQQDGSHAYGSLSLSMTMSF